MYNDNFKEAFAQSMEERMVLPFLNVPDYKFPNKFEKKMQNLFKHPHSYILVKNKIIPLRKILICAIIVLMTFILTFTTAAYWSEIKSFFTEVFTDHTKVTYVTEDETPKTIETIYIPEYIPSGFILQESENDMLSTYFLYANEIEYFYLEQYTKDAVMNVNSELANLEMIYINEHEGFYLKYEDRINLTWTTNEYTFTIKSNIDKSEIIKIAESVKN